MGSLSPPPPPTSQGCCEVTKRSKVPESPGEVYKAPDWRVALPSPFPQRGRTCSAPDGDSGIDGAKGVGVGLVGRRGRVTQPSPWLLPPVRTAGCRGPWPGGARRGQAGAQQGQGAIQELVIRARGTLLLCPGESLGVAGAEQEPPPAFRIPRAVSNPAM